MFRLSSIDNDYRKLVIVISLSRTTTNPRKLPSDLHRYQTFLNDRIT